MNIQEIIENLKKGSSEGLQIQKTKWNFNFNLVNLLKR